MRNRYNSLFFQTTWNGQTTQQVLTSSTNVSGPPYHFDQPFNESGPAFLGRILPSKKPRSTNPYKKCLTHFPSNTSNNNNLNPGVVTTKLSTATSSRSYMRDFSTGDKKSLSAIFIVLNDEVILEVNRVVITGKDMRTLMPSRWLCSEIINSYLKLISARADKNDG